MRRAVVVAVVVLQACGGADQALPSVDTVRSDAARAMETVATASFAIERNGAPITIDGLEFVSATGVYAAPDRSRAVLEVRAGDVTARLGTVAIGERVWLTDPITSAWSALDPGTGFNPAVVFDPDLGWTGILAEDLTDVTVERAGSDRLRLWGIVGAERVATLTAGLADPQPTAVEFVIDEDTDRIVEVAFATEGDAGTSTWSIRIEAYDEPVTVEPPDA